jgi:hypothetical protein
MPKGLTPCSSSLLKNIELIKLTIPVLTSRHGLKLTHNKRTQTICPNELFGDTSRCKDKSREQLQPNTDAEFNDDDCYCHYYDNNSK